jgi:hypothetical protein
MVVFYFILFADKTSDKAKKYLEGLDGITLNEMSVPESLKNQLQNFDRDVSFFFIMKMFEIKRFFFFFFF